MGDFSQSVSRFRWKGKGRLEYVAGQKQSFKEGARPVKTEGKGEDLKEVIERERREKKREPDRKEREGREETGAGAGIGRIEEAEVEREGEIGREAEARR